MSGPAAPPAVTPRAEAIFLLVCAIAFWAGAVVPAFPDLWNSPWSVVQDDGRHFVAWLRRLADPGLFPGDPIADYFSALTPQLYRALYVPAAWMGIDMQVWHLFVATPLAIGGFFWSANRFLRHLVPDTVLRLTVLAFMAQALTLDLNLGLPRSFREAIVFASLAFFLERRPLAFAFAIGLGANLYPSAAAVAGLALALFCLWRWVRARGVDRAEFARLALGGAAAIAGLAWFALSSGQWGETVTLAGARDMVIFGPGGRTAFFRDTYAATLLCDGRGGMLPLCAGGGLVSLLLAVAGLSAGWFAIRRIAPASDVGAADARRLLLALVAAGLLLFAIAWALAFRLHLPSRFRLVSLDLVWHIGLGALLAVALRRALAALRRADHRPFAAAAILLVALGVAKGDAARQLRHDTVPRITQFLRDAPRDALVAGLPEATDSLPAFAGRAVWVSPELTVPYKEAYLDAMTRRAEILFALLEGPADARWRELLEGSSIDYMLVNDARAGDRRASRDARSWSRTFPLAGDHARRLEAGTPDLFSAEADVAQACTAARDGDVILIDMACFAQRAAAGG